MLFNTYWFRPKKFGYGATPTTWEGWTLIISYLVSIFYLTYQMNNLILYIVVLICVTIFLILITYYKTQGKWCWRWGNK